MTTPTASSTANSLMTSLADPLDPTITLPDFSNTIYQLPVVLTGPLYAAQTKLTNAHLTERSLTGNGAFDALMAGFNVHLQREYDLGRITGEQYAKAYVELTTAAMGSAVQYLLGRETSYWQAMLAQQQAQAAEAQVIAARVEVETAKMTTQLVHYQVDTQKAQYATAKMQLATAQIGYSTAAYNLDNMLPKQEVKLDKEILLLGNEITLFGLKQTLLREQGESQRAQTLDTRSDTLPVAGVLGKQRSLYDQQITSYQRDAEVKAAKMFVDAWITQKTIDEGITPPSGFTNASLDTVLTHLKVNNGLD